METEVRSTRDVAISADKRAKRTDLASVTALIVALTGFVAVFVHKPTEDGAREGYIELGKSGTFIGPPLPSGVIVPPAPRRELAVNTLPVGNSVLSSSSSPV